MLRTVDLFSGIGGFSLGLGMAGGFETIAFCEQDKFCQQVLRKHWPDVPIHNDIRTLPTDGFGDIDLVCGGFPCQPWSDAGKKLGTEDDRDLWPEMACIIEKLRPKWVIGENVRGFVNEPMGLQRSLSDLERIGYQAVPFVIPACAVDAPHRRDRVWIVAHSDSDSEPDGSLHAVSRQGELVDDAAREQLERRVDNGGTPSRGPHGQFARSNKDVADTRSPREKRLPQNDKDQERQTIGGTQSGGGCDGSVYGQSGENWWTVEPDVGRVAHGVPRRVDRLKALGNAVVPQVVEQLGRAILDDGSTPIKCRFTRYTD